MYNLSRNKAKKKSQTVTPFATAVINIHKKVRKREVIAKFYFLYTCRLFVQRFCLRRPPVKFYGK